MSYKVEVQTNNGVNWASNAVRFATPEEAKAYGHQLMMRWTAVDDVRVAQSEDAVNYVQPMTPEGWASERERPCATS